MAAERMEVVDIRGEVILALPVGVALVLAGHILDVVAEIAEAHPTVEAMISEPTVTAADLATHADDPVPALCPVCRVSRCPDWRFATERLMCAEAGNVR